MDHKNKNDRSMDNTAVKKKEENSNVKRRNLQMKKEYEEAVKEREQKVTYEKSKISQTLAKMISEKGSMESLGCKGPSTSLCNVDQMNHQKLQDTLKRAKKDLREPFSFLANIPSEEAVDDYVRSKELEITDIDTRLANLVKRIELNRTLLEKTNQHIKDIDSCIEKSKLTAPKNELYDEEIFVKMKKSDTTKTDEQESVLAEFPEIEDLRRTMNKTRDMLNYVKKIAKGEIDSDEPPAELLVHVNSKKKEEKCIHNQEN